MCTYQIYRHIDLVSIYLFIHSIAVFLWQNYQRFCSYCTKHASYIYVVYPTYVRGLLGFLSPPVINHLLPLIYHKISILLFDIFEDDDDDDDDNDDDDDDNDNNT